MFAVLGSLRTTALEHEEGSGGQGSGSFTSIGWCIGCASSPEAGLLGVRGPHRELGIWVTHLTGSVSLQAV